MGQRKLNLSRICFCLGIILITASMLLLVGWQVSAYRNKEQAQEYINMIYELIPESQAAVVEPRVNNEMPYLNINKENFVAIIEIPMNEASFPVGASWDNNKKYPCLYNGSVYDGSLVIGTSNQKGQFDFVKEISVGNAIYITDMTGNRFSYEVSDIRYCKHANNDTLYGCEDDLTIFIKNIYAFEYIILHCTVSGT